MTINNPEDHGFTREKIIETLTNCKSIVFFCMSDEIGEEGTPHTHIYFVASSPMRFSTIKNMFPSAHIEVAHGTSEQNRDYVYKIGKWEQDAKGETNLRDTHFEWGEMPAERQGARNDLTMLYDMIKSGMSNYEIIEQAPQFLNRIDDIERVRQMLLEEESKNTFRKMHVTYVSGATGLGKTRHIMEKYGYENVYRVTDYGHGGFDYYKGQKAIAFDEYSSSYKIQSMLNYLDGYPIALPCRYMNRVACYTDAYIVSNIPLINQYPNIQQYEPAVWNAFLRRIDTVMCFYDYNRYNEFTVAEYLNLPPDPTPDGWREITDTRGLPFGGQA